MAALPATRPAPDTSVASVVNALTSVDSRLIEVLSKGQIKLVSTAWLLLQPDGQPWKRRQDLEALEQSGERPLLTAEDAVAALQAANRAIAVISHGWLEQGQPDRKGYRLRAIRQYLRKHPTLLGLFFDYSSLPQHPRTEAEDVIFKAGLNVMGDLYASPLGTTVLQLKFIPPKPSEVAVELFNSRPYDDRGWCRFEDAVSTEAIARLAYYPALSALLSTLPTEKIMQFQVDGAGEPVSVEADAQNGMRSRIEAVVQSIQDATFTGKGDKPVVVNLYREYCAKIGSAITDAAPGGVAEVYIGERNATGQKEGYGTLSSADGDTYTGQWKSDMAHGVGMYTWATGSKYEGQWNMFDQEGQGTFTWANGTTYVGTWKKDREDGRGRKTFADGSVYDGEFTQGVKQGRGEYTDSNRSYKGEFAADQFHGHGRHAWLTGVNAGQVYEGQWQKGIRIGHGKMSWPGGDVYEGQWEDSKRNGHGRMAYANGDVYEGQWRDAKRHGQGKVEFADGRQQDATWIDDHIAQGVQPVARASGNCLGSISKLLRCCCACFARIFSGYPASRRAGESSSMLSNA
jgi:hypothetical protein